MVCNIYEKWCVPFSFLCYTKHSVDLKGETNNMERRNAWKIYTADQLKELDQINSRYKVCLDEGKTERECVRLTVKEIEKKGYRNLKDIKGSLKAGDKVYAVCMGKSIAMFQIGKEPLEKGMNILGAHIDSPRIDVKQNPLYENENLAYLDTHYYGGIKKYQWVTLPLALHGVIVKTDGTVQKVNIVTGPNTGGKTVSLKTVGLFTLMGQAGLHIPALDRSELAIFENVYADIGDEQSIEQSLSTFSSHMTNIVSFLKHVDEHSLVLFDELNAGTDPTEGAALAIAILSYLHQRGIRTMATTHYSELKVFALSTPGVENACCEFDVETLSPTYRLLIGIPGKSNAFAIAGKLGLPDYIIEDAKTHLTEQDESFEDLLTDLETSKRTIRKEQEEIEHYKRELARLEEETRQKRDKLEEQRDRIIREANEKAHEILADAKETADETMRNFHKFGKANISVAEMEKERERLRKKMNATQNSMKTDTKKPKKAYKPSDFKLGESVKVLSMNLTGSVTSLPDSKGNVTVQMGILRSTVNISDLEIIDEAPAYSFAKRTRQTGKGKVKMGKSLAISPEINLLGKTVDEAIAELDKYLDDASLAHLSSVRIVHGKGTGALRAGIHKYLKRQKHVKSFRLGAFGEGDAGVTIAELK